jgi:hypothetical protein
MSQIVIRNLDPAVIAALRRRAVELLPASAHAVATQAVALDLDQPRR